MPKCDLILYNTLTRKREKFIPINKDWVGIYNCGPTLREFHTQIGNLRSYVFADLVKRYFLYLGFNVKHVIKITDVDDHSLKESKEKGLDLSEYTKQYFEDFNSQLKKMNIALPYMLPRVTENIDSILRVNKILLEKGLAYISNGSLYFSISKIKNYGVLLNKDKKKSLKKNAQLRLKDFVNDDKENNNDFCLWKAYRADEDGEIFWESEFGKGRPGWHVECTAISQKFLGDNFDIHIGGISHIFPHHTNEIAIAEAACGKKFVNYWLHHDYLIVDGEKMSKEKGTLYTLSSILEKGYNPLILRFVLLSTHYRQKLNFTWRSMDDAKRIILKIVLFLNSLDFVNNKVENDIDIEFIIEETRKNVEDSFNNDFNISNVIRSLMLLIKTVNNNFNNINSAQVEKIKNFIFKVDSIFGCFKPLYEDYKKKIIVLDPEGKIKDIYQKRLDSRRDKNYVLSDSYKKDIEDMGFIIKDSTQSSDFYYELRMFSDLM